MELRGKKVFLDTAPLIYYMEETGVYTDVLNEIFSSEHKCLFVTSVITLTEVLVLPLRKKQEALARKYETILTHSPNMQIIAIDTEIAKTTAKLRAKYALKTPDALQIASAIHTSADYFLTNDKQLKSVKELQIILLDELI